MQDVMRSLVKGEAVDQERACDISCCGLWKHVEQAGEGARGDTSMRAM